MPTPLTRDRRGILACAALFLTALALTFPVLPAYSASSAALRLLERSRERHRRLQQPRAIGGPGEVTYNGER